MVYTLFLTFYFPDSGLLQRPSGGTGDLVSSLEYFADYLTDSGILGNDDALTAELLKERKIVTCTGLNAQFSKEIVSKLVYLSTQSETEPIDIYLRTEGGWGADVFAVVDVMRSIKAPVNVHALGEVHSAGLIILGAATGERIAYPHTVLSFHSLTNDEEVEIVDRYQKFFREFTKLPESWITDRSDEFYYMTAEKAVEYELVDVVKTQE